MAGIAKILARKFAKTFAVSLQFILAASVLAVVYGFFADGVFTLAYVFFACFLTGAAIICVAVIIMILPAGFKPDKLTDHTTVAERYLDKHAKKQKRAFSFLYLGLSVIVITGLLQLLLAQVILSVMPQ